MSDGGKKQDNATAAVNAAYNNLKSQYFHDAIVPGKLYHYTDTAGLLGIVRNGEIWLSNHAFMNDSSELRRGIKLVEQIVRKTREASGLIPGSDLDKYLDTILDLASNTHVEIDPYVTCFSEVQNDLNQWRVYGGSVGSFCVEFDGKGLEKILLTKNIILNKVDYSFESQFDLVRNLIAEISTSLREDYTEEDVQIVASAVGARISFELARYKASAFAPEREWRGIVAGWHSANTMDFRASRFGLTPYLKTPLKNDQLPLPITGIIAGPSRYPEQTQYALLALVEKLGMTGKIECAVSELPIQY